MPISTRTPETHQPTQPEDQAARNHPPAQAEAPGSHNPGGKQPASAQRARTRKARSKM